jgi:hypothetical protein
LVLHVYIMIVAPLSVMNFSFYWENVSRKNVILGQIVQKKCCH